MWASGNSPTRMDPRPTNSARILARSSSFCVPRRTKLVCGHSSGRPHVLFSPHGGLVCGRLAIRPHTSFTHAEGAGVWAFITSPTRPSPSPHPKLAVAMCFCRYMATALALLVSRWQLSFTRVAMCFCMVHGNCPSVHVSRWQLFLFTWQLP